MTARERAWLFAGLLNLGDRKVVDLLDELRASLLALPGVSGLALAYRLSREHDVTVFEARDRVGGNIRTEEIEAAFAETAPCSTAATSAASFAPSGTHKVRFAGFGGSILLHGIGALQHTIEAAVAGALPRLLQRAGLQHAHVAVAGHAAHRVAGGEGARLMSPLLDHPMFQQL